MPRIHVTDPQGRALAGAEVVVNGASPLPFNLGGYIAIDVTDSNGDAIVPQYAQPFGGSTFDVRGSWTDSRKVVYEGQTSWTVDWLGNFQPDPMPLELIPNFDANFAEIATATEETQTNQPEDLSKKTTDVLVLLAVLVVAVILLVNVVLPALTKRR